MIKPPVTGFKYIATHTPSGADVPESMLQKDQTVTFDDIAGASQGDKLLAYIKSDVDNLGEIIQTRFSVSRFTTFSRMLETFFAGYLNMELTTAPYGQIYTVFSGGDDFFLVGPWNKTIDFAGNIRRDFTAFCADNPDLTFSSGVVMAKPHEPFRFCAERVDD